MICVFFRQSIDVVLIGAPWNEARAARRHFVSMATLFHDRGKSLAMLTSLRSLHLTSVELFPPQLLLLLEKVER